MESLISSPALEQVTSLLNSERVALQNLLHLLENEQSALVSAHMDGLIEILEEKNSTLSGLAKTSQDRVALLSGLGLTPNGSTEEQLKKVLPTAVSIWQDILQLLEKTRQANQVNGNLIQTRLRVNQQALSVLQNAAQSASLYGRDGQPNLPGSGRILGSG